MGIFSLVTGRPGPNGFGSASTAEQVTEGVDGSNYLTAIVTGHFLLTNLLLEKTKHTARSTGVEGRIVNLSSIALLCTLTTAGFDSKILMIGAVKNFEVVHLLDVEECTQGAATTLYVVLHPKLKGVTGKYFVDCNEMKSSSYARDEKLANKLWDFSNKLIDGASVPKAE